MNTLPRKPFNLTSQRVYAFSVLALFALSLLGVLLPTRVADLQNTYGLALTCLLFGAYIARFASGERLEAKVYMLWLVWMLITRWLNSDVYLFVDFDLMITCILSFLLMSAGAVADKKGREVFLDILTLMYVGLALVVAVLGIFVFVTNTYIHIPPENVWVSIRYDGTVFAPIYFSMNRQVSAFRFMVAWCLLVYQFAKRKNKLVRAVVAACLLVLFVAIALCHTRGAQISMMAAFALIAMLIGQNLFKNKKQIVAVAGSGALALVMALGSYFCNDMVCDAMTSAHNTVAPAFAEYYNGIENKINEEYFGIGRTADEMIKYENEQRTIQNSAEASATKTEVGKDVVLTPLSVKADTRATAKELSANTEFTADDPRTLKGNWNLTGRTWIWHSGIVSIIHDPMIALRGLLLKNVAPTFNAVMAELYPAFQPQINMHNAYLQVLMVCGVPGLIMVLVWTVLLVIKMVKLFFAPREVVSDEIKILTVPLAAPFVLSLSENLIFTSLDLNAMVFYLCVGVFLGYYYDIYPVKTKNK